MFFILLGVKLGLLVRTRVHVYIRYSILIVIADPGIFTRILRHYLCTGWGIKISTFRRGTVRAVVGVERWGNVMRLVSLYRCQ